eukprot:824476-Pleurochrysis_carterae.AAC.3
MARWSGARAIGGHAGAARDLEGAGRAWASSPPAPPRALCVSPPCSCNSTMVLASAKTRVPDAHVRAQAS